MPDKKEATDRRAAQAVAVDVKLEATTSAPIVIPSYPNVNEDPERFMVLAGRPKLGKSWPSLTFTRTESEP